MATLSGHEVNPATGGKYANTSGRVLEAQVQALFERHGFTVIKYRDWNEQRESYSDTDLLVCGVPYTSIYGHKAKTEFVAISKRLGLNARIECKWQQSAGSVDEKFPYLYLNCVFAMEEPLVIVVVDGGGAKPQALAWLKQAAKRRDFIPNENTEKAVEVLSLAEFTAWGNRRLRG
jgi:hypothetical protein